MPNLLISQNNGFIPFVKNYDDDYLGFEEKHVLLWEVLDNLKKIVSTFYSFVWQWSSMVL